MRCAEEVGENTRNATISDELNGNVIIANDRNEDSVFGPQAMQICHDDIAVDAVQRKRH